MSHQEFFLNYLTKVIEDGTLVIKHFTTHLFKNLDVLKEYKPNLKLVDMILFDSLDVQKPVDILPFCMKLAEDHRFDTDKNYRTHIVHLTIGLMLSVFYPITMMDKLSIMVSESQRESALLYTFKLAQDVIKLI